jgi:hypothetical protein
MKPKHADVAGTVELDHDRAIERLLVAHERSQKVLE